MKQLRIVTAVCTFGLSIAQVNAEDQLLVDEGKAYIEIVISEARARSTVTELQTCVAKNSGTPGFSHLERLHHLASLLGHGAGCG
jgi:hypothetical protein